MSAQAEIMARARERGACERCCYQRHASEVQREHPECYSIIIAVMDEKYEAVPTEALRLILYRDGMR